MTWLRTFADIQEKDWTEASDELRSETAREVCVIAGYASAAATILPLPVIDLAVLLPINTAMVMTIARVYGRTLSKTEARKVVMELGAVAGVTLAGQVAVGVLKRWVLPLIGGLVAAPATFAVTYGFGRLAMAYFADPERGSEELNEVFKEAVKESGAEFSREAFDRFRATEAEVPEAEAPPEEPAARRPEPARRKKRTL